MSYNFFEKAFSLISDFVKNLFGEKRENSIKISNNDIANSHIDININNNIRGDEKDFKE